MLRKVYDILTIDSLTGKTLYEDSRWIDVRLFAVQAKKGRGEAKQATQGLLTTAGQYNNFIPTSPNAFSPAVQSEYDSDLANVRNTYGNLAQSGFRTLAARGFGSAPTGALSSLLAQNNQVEGNGEQQAYQQAQKNNVNQGFQALAGKTGAYSGASNAAVNQNKTGSTLGDIGSAIFGGAGAAGDILKGLNA